MSRLKADYENTLFGKLEGFVNGREKSCDADAYMAEDCGNKGNDSVSGYTQDELENRTGRMLDFYGLVYKIFAVLFTVLILFSLLVMVSYLPRYANAANPADNYVMERYIEKGMQETGTVNAVTGLILNYRGFDTMGETHVLYIAASTVMILLLITKKSALTKDEYMLDRYYEPKNDLIIKKVAVFLVPVIAVFGIYVILNGHISPGGGFSGGAILGAGLILYVSAFGFKKMERFFNEHIYVVAKVSALCCYISCLSYYFYMGANGFDNHIPLGTPGAIISSGLILFIDIFVGTEVACTMYAFYALFRRGEI